MKLEDFKKMNFTDMYLELMRCKGQAVFNPAMCESYEKHLGSLPYIAETMLLACTQKFEFKKGGIPDVSDLIQLNKRIKSKKNVPCNQDVVPTVEGAYNPNGVFYFDVIENVDKETSEKFLDKIATDENVPDFSFYTPIKKGGNVSDLKNIVNLYLEEKKDGKRKKDQSSERTY